MIEQQLSQSLQNQQMSTLAGKRRLFIDKELFSEPSAPSVNLVLTSPKIDDRVRWRANKLWANNFIYSPAQMKPAFTINVTSEQRQIEGDNMFGVFEQDIELVANKNMFNIDDNVIPNKTNIYNSQYWRKFIIEQVQEVITPTVQDVMEGKVEVVADQGTIDRRTSVQQNTNNPQQNTRNVATAPLPPPKGITTTDTQNPQQASNIGSGIESAGVSTTPTITQNVNQTNRRTTVQQNTSAPQRKDTKGIVPTIQEDKTFTDHVCSFSIPFSREEYMTLNPPAGFSYFDIKGEYVFYEEDYELVIGNSSLQEKLLPSLYVFASEQNNEITDEISTIFKEFITLSNTIKDIFVDILNQKGQKIDEKDKGEYLQQYSSAISEFLRTKPQEKQRLEQRGTNVVVPTSQFDLLKKYNIKKDQFPMYCSVSFSTQKLTHFSDILKETKVFGLLSKDVIEGYFQAETKEFKETFETIKIDEKGFPRQIMNETFLTKEWDLISWIKESLQNASKELLNGFYIGTYDDESKLNDPQYDFYKNLLFLIFIGKVKNIVEQRFRTYKNIMDGNKAHCETIFYKIQKIDFNTNEVLQNFFVPNINDVDVLEFIDTQVKYNKKYKYKIFAYQMVVGNKYSYSLKELTDDKAKVVVKNEPSVKLIELLFCETDVRVVDKPPVPPDVLFVPYKGVDDKILLLFNNGVGRVFQEGIKLLPEDEENIKNVLENQRSKNTIEYYEDDIASYFDVFRITSKPSSYNDFFNRKRVSVATDVNLKTLQKASNIGFVDDLQPNQKYYYIFRAVDVHGHISNPTKVFEVELVNNQSSVYPVVKNVDFNDVNEKFKSPVKTFRRFLKIQPNINQTILNEEKSGLVENGKRVKSLEGHQNFHLGILDQQVWEKTFRIVLTSKQSGKRVEFDLTFQNKNINKNV